MFFILFRWFNCWRSKIEFILMRITLGVRCRGYSFVYVYAGMKKQSSRNKFEVK